ncbi:ferredoxin [Nocardia sp. NPDC052278]|uniref:ferredoxin n=1 Tax=unclassified Nocardia TaxID=2637762 RepID=UPI00367CF2F1
MKVSVDRELCAGHGQCFAFAPEVFEPDEDGFCVVRVPVPNPELADAARTGAQACPERAITVDD